MGLEQFAMILPFVVPESSNPAVFNACLLELSSLIELMAYRVNDFN